MTTTINAELSPERVNKAVEAILSKLEPKSDLHKRALTAFQSGDHLTVKRLASTNLADNYCKALGYLGSASKLTPNTDTILAESARSAAEHVKDVVLAELGASIAEALG